MAAAEKNRQALILFAHGARDARWADPLVRIRQLIVNRVGGAAEVHLAFLELMSPTLPELVPQLVAAQIESIYVVPIFLGQGGHVRNDLPALLHELTLAYPQVQFELKPAIGESAIVLDAIAEVCISSL